mgnify:CR=1 FL=1
MREGDRKLVWESKQKGWELYDLAADRTELHNLAAAYPEEVARLSAAWETWAEGVELKVKP